MIVLTGAGGFLGSHIMKRLLDGNEPIRVLVRSQKRFFDDHPEFTAHANRMELIEIDFGNHRVAPKMLADADCIIHAAATVSLASEDLQTMQRINVDTTADLLQHTPQNAYFLFIGSVVAYGPTGTEPADEAQPFPLDSCSPYEETKRAATMLVRKAMENGKPCGILHPGIVYGPNAHGSLTRFASAVLHKRLPVMAGSDTLASFVYVDDVVNCVLEMIRCRTNEELIATGEVASLSDFLSEIVRQGGGRAPTFHLSANSVGRLVRLPTAIFRWFGASFPLTPTLLRVASHHWAYRSDRAQTILGMHFRGNREGIAAWLKSGTLH